MLPEHRKGPSAWIWSPEETMVIFPEGSISISTVRPVMLSEGGKASMIPPDQRERNVLSSQECTQHIPSRADE